MATLELTIVLGAFALLIYLLKTRTNHKLPPGPKGLPFIGSALSMEKDPYKTYAKWAQTYGDLTTFTIFGKRMIMITDTKLAREAYNHPPLLGRAYMEAFETYFRGVKHYPKEVARGVLSAEGAPWAENRRFTLRHLRDFGFGKSSMENNIQAEVGLFMASLDQHKGKPIELWRPFAAVSSNSMWRIIAGERLIHDKEKAEAIEGSIECNGPNKDESLRNITEFKSYWVILCCSQVLKHLSSPISVFLPTIAKTFATLTGWKEFEEVTAKMHNVFHQFVDDHKKEFSPENEPRDFMDAYLKKISETMEESSCFYGSNGVNSLKLTSTDLFIAGSESTGTTMSWLVLYLTTFPELQERLAKDIETVVGNSRTPVIADRINIPFAEAVINETLRKSNFTASGVNHRAMEDTELRGYTIPKDSWVFVNQYFIHHDPRVWGDPENFRPERFLMKGPDGSVSMKKFEELLPFSIGKRVCIGEQLAKDLLFLSTTTFFQKYRTRFDPHSPKPSLDARTYMFRAPEKFKVILEERL